MTRIIPRRKSYIIPLTVIGVILSLVLSCYTACSAYMLTGDIGGYRRFCIIVKNGGPIQSFRCKDEKLLYYKDSFAAIVESIPEEARFDGAAFYTGGDISGGYPIYNLDYKTKPPLGHTSPLPIQIILRDKAEQFVRYFAYALIIFSPLIILLAVSLFLHRFYTAKEYKNNAQAVFEAAEVYVSECKDTFPIWYTAEC